MISCHLKITMHFEDNCKVSEIVIRENPMTASFRIVDHPTYKRKVYSEAAVDSAINLSERLNWSYRRELRVLRDGTFTERLSELTTFLNSSFSISDLDISGTENSWRIASSNLDCYFCANDCCMVDWLPIRWRLLHLRASMSGDVIQYISECLSLKCEYKLDADPAHWNSLGFRCYSTDGDKSNM